MKKILIVLLSLFLLISIGGCSNNSKQEERQIVEGKYPIKWDDTLLYADENAFMADIEKIKQWPIEIQSYKGKLDTTEGLYGYFSTYYSFDYRCILDKLAAYVKFGEQVYPMEKKYQDCELKLNEIYNLVNSSTNYIQEEMATIPYEKRVEIISDERMEKYRPLCISYLQENISTIDEATSRAIQAYNLGTITYGRASRLFDTFVNYEMPDTEYKLKNGETIFISDSNLSSYMGGDYDDSTKLGIFDAYWGNVSQYKNTLASLIETELMEQYSNAQFYGYDNTRDLALDNLQLEQDIIQKIIDFAHKYSNTNIEYSKLYSSTDGKYYTYGKMKRLSTYKPTYIEYDDGIDEIIDALSVLGKEYIDTFKEIITSGQVDVYPAENKASGALQIGNFAGLNPFLMLNYKGTTSDVADIAHEMGHACYSKLTDEYTEMYYWNPPTFTQEVASITNELIYYYYKINNAKTDEERMYHIEQCLSRWTSDMINGCFWQEFENYCHEIVESGNHLDPDDLCDKWAQLTKEYYGEDVNLGQYGQYRWATLKSIINNYYQYSYATSICYATVLSLKIINNEPNAVDNYLEFLKAGRSVSPAEALKIAGIDIYGTNDYNDAFYQFAKLVNELKELKNK